MNSEEPKLAAPIKVTRLDLAGGLHPREGFDSVDIVSTPKTKYVINLLNFPWPFETESITELNCCHFIEHIPMLWVSREGVIKLMAENATDKEMFFAFFDECYRILKPGCFFHVQVPALQTSRAFQDPTHRRFLPAESFKYLNKKVRNEWGISHYNVNCNFEVTADAMIPRQEGRVPEAEQRMINHWWNYVFDWKVTLRKQ